MISKKKLFEKLYSNHKKIPFIIALITTLSFLFLPIISPKGSMLTGISFIGLLDYINHFPTLVNGSYIYGYQTAIHLIRSFIIGTWLIVIGRYNIKNRLSILALIGLLLYIYTFYTSLHLLYNNKNIYIGLDNVFNGLNIGVGLGTILVILGCNILFFIGLKVVLFMIIKKIQIFFIEISENNELNEDGTIKIDIDKINTKTTKLTNIISIVIIILFVLTYIIPILIYKFEHVNNSNQINTTSEEVTNDVY